MGLLGRVSVPPPIGGSQGPIPTTTLGLFISHSWGYGEHRSGLTELLQKEWIKNIDFRDRAVPREHPIEDAEGTPELFDMLRNRILVSEVLLVLGGMYATNSTWIEREVLIARALAVPIIAVTPNGQERVSSVATTFAAERVYWRGASVRDAILRHVKPARAAALRAQVKRRRIAEESRAAISGYKPSPVAFPNGPPRRPAVPGTPNKLLLGDMILGRGPT